MANTLRTAGVILFALSLILGFDAATASRDSGSSYLTTTKTSTLTQYTTTVVGGTTTTLTNQLTKVVTQTETSVLTQVGTTTVFLAPTTTILNGQTQTITTTVSAPVTTYYYPITTTKTLTVNGQPTTSTVTTTLSFTSFTYGTAIPSYTPPAGEVHVYVYESTSQVYASYTVPQAGAKVVLLPPPTSSTCVSNCVGPAMTQTTDVNGKAVFTGVPTGMAYITVTDLTNQVSAQSVFVGSTNGALVKFIFVYNLSIVRASILGIAPAIGLMNEVALAILGLVISLPLLYFGGRKAAL